MARTRATSDICVSESESVGSERQDDRFRTRKGILASSIIVRGADELLIPGRSVNFLIKS